MFLVYATSADLNKTFGLWRPRSVKFGLIIYYNSYLLFVIEEISNLSFFIHKRFHLVVQIKQVGVVFPNVCLCVRDELADVSEAGRRKEA